MLSRAESGRRAGQRRLDRRDGAPEQRRVPGGRDDGAATAVPRAGGDRPVVPEPQQRGGQHHRELHAHRRDQDDLEQLSPTLAGMPAAPETLLLAAPRGYCAGVDRAVQTVEHALDLYGAPVYVRKEIVHNKHVVEQLRERGAIFVESETEVPEGATAVFSAHGVAPSVHENAAARELNVIDATCPLVTKVHREALKFAADDYTIVMIGHDGHEEVEGTMGEAPDHIVLVQS